MAKDLNNIYNAKSLDSVYPNKIESLLNEGKTLIIPVHNGVHMSASLAKGYSDFLKANIELKEEKALEATCGCGEKANILVYVWR
ncbi:hypothetical protein EELLY_v1c01420 [Entomoplasma ellychniae]|uniref:Uncharacterized protein n=1 Tax=Entomoplasma ellychniae TaxID=2114 RepID=A0A8E2QVJ1_9MOLU|nr:hypothetical protein [Entomoplasma ellychniae]PPE04467.1 hypothetical protein EELLY_v1c01420 [Entomoplasma ellychniae]